MIQTEEQEHLARQDVEELDDNYLVNLVREEKNDEALIQLMQRHSGIFHKTVTDYLPPSLNYGEREDVYEEKPSYFFDAILSFDESRNAKFVTWLANRTRYSMLTKRSKEKAKPIFCEFDESLGGVTGLTPDTYYEKRTDSEKVLQLVFDKYGEDMYDLFKDKYFGGPNRTGKTFNEIADGLGVSPQAIQAKHRTVLKFLKRKLK